MKTIILRGKKFFFVSSGVTLFRNFNFFGCYLNVESTICNALESKPDLLEC